MSGSHRWFFTLNEQECLSLDGPFQELFKKELGKFAKKWVFQLERGAVLGRLHFQGRLSLVKKKRHAEIVKQFHPEWNITWLHEYGDEPESFTYVTKDETRVAGPWSDRDQPKYVPRQIRGITLQGWQLELRNHLQTWDTRRIHFVVDPAGGIGKSTFVTYMRVMHQAIKIPQSCQTADDMMQYACKMVGERKTDIIFLIDVPRAVPDKSWGKWISVMEDLKTGFMYDHRYTAVANDIDCPGICLFCNEEPPSFMLTSDKWVIHRPPRFNVIDIE